MAENRLFASGELLDRWIRDGQVELSGSVLILRATGHRYELLEAVHVLSEVTGAGDPHDLVGRVRTARELFAAGAEVLDRAMVLGEAAYDVTPGFVMTPLDAPPGGLRTDAAVAVLSRLSGVSPRVQSDEELLARYLIDKLE